MYQKADYYANQYHLPYNISGHVSGLFTMCDSYYGPVLLLIRLIFTPVLSYFALITHLNKSLLLLL